jgi:hypothetical protein
MRTTNYKTKIKKEKPVRKIYKELTLDEYDDLTLEHQGIGASCERGNIVTELERRAAQLREFSDKSGLVPSADRYAMDARGLEMAIRFINGVRAYEDNVGCLECDAF